ncbi:MAG TPA: uracil-DNA glycosylase [Acidimicrobiales bacterium]|nr:uracil-DNA glycosylase [Acidimicrobiales bacterium]
MVGGRAELANISREIVACRACPRLVAWREEVATLKRAAFADQVYWGRAVPGFGDPEARIAVVGLAPAAHGANRTGRIFTGDRSGDWLFASMYRTGLANQPTSQSADDGLVLRDVWVSSAVRCAPPANRPLPDERDRCTPYLVRELAALTKLGVVVVLGQFAYDVVSRVLGVASRPRFGHGVEVAAAPGLPAVLCSYHPSQQNTFTGRLTTEMLDSVFIRAAALVTRPVR